MKSFKQYIFEAIKYESLELTNQTKFKFKRDTADIQIPLTPQSEKKLKNVWNDWENILTINGEVKSLQKSLPVGISAYLGSYVFITKKELSDQKSYEDRISDKSYHKQIKLHADLAKKLSVLKTDGIMSMDIISIPNSKLKVPIFKTLSGNTITPTAGDLKLNVEGLIHIIRVAKLSSKKKLIDYLESKILNNIIGEMVRVEKVDTLMKLLGPKFKNWQKIVFGGNKQLETGSALFTNLIRGSEKLLTKELKKITEKDIVDSVNNLIRKYSKVVPANNLEQYLQ